MIGQGHKLVLTEGPKGECCESCWYENQKNKALTYGHCPGRNSLQGLVCGPNHIWTLQPVKESQ